MLNSNSNIGDQKAAAEVAPSQDQPKEENYQYQVDDENDSRIEDNYYHKVYPAEEELLEIDQASPQQVPDSATLRPTLHPLDDSFTNREIDKIQMDFSIIEELKEAKTVYLGETQPEKLMLTEGEEDEDASFIYGGQNGYLIMNGEDKSSTGPHEKTPGEKPFPFPIQDFKLDIMTDAPFKLQIIKKEASESNKENITLDWAMKNVGTQNEISHDELVANMLKTSENDFYPLSIYFSDKQKRKMKITRLIVFFALFYFIIPFDLYIPQTDYRIGYYGTYYRNEKITFSEDVTKSNDTFQFDLTNCAVYFLNDDNEQENSFLIEFGFAFGVYHEFNSTYLRIDADPTTTCNVYLYLPLAPMPLPYFRFNMTGTQENIIFDDQWMGGAPLNFSRGLDIFGETAFVFLHNQYARELSIKLQFSVCRLHYLRTQYRHIEIEAGIYTEVIDPTYSQQAVIIANQPAGDICIVSPALKQHPNNTNTCKLIDSPTLLEPTNPLSPQQQLANSTPVVGNSTIMESNLQQPKTKCFIASIACANSEECSEQTQRKRLRMLREEQPRRRLQNKIDKKNDTKTASLNKTEEVEPEENPYEAYEIYYQFGIPITNVTVLDGLIQVKFLNEESSPTDMMQKIQKTRKSITFSKESLKLMNTTASLFRSDDANSYIQQLQTVGETYERNWLYTNKLQYLQAQYWPLVWGSAGLLRPIVTSKKIIFIDRTCPARLQSLVVDQEIGDYYFQVFPQTKNSQVAFVDGLSQYYEIIVNSYGQGMKRRITLSDNPMLVAAFAISGCIGILGGFAILWIIFLSLKTLRRQYQLYLNKQTQLAITIKQQSLSNIEVELDNRNMLMEFKQSQQYYEFKDVFTNKFEKFKIQEKEMDNLEFSLSIFQISYLVVDKFVRMNLNSLHQFLDEIKESKIHFTYKKMNQYDKTDVSMPFYEFQQIYSSFCSKKGFTEIPNLEVDGAEIFELFALTLETFEEKLEPAYINLRFKTIKEKNAADEKEKTLLSADKGGNIIGNRSAAGAKNTKRSGVVSFLNRECIYSQFKSDYISFQELEYSYKNFCQNWDIVGSMREQIIGSTELLKFGASIFYMAPPKRIIGIKRGFLVDSSDSEMSHGLIRVYAGSLVESYQRAQSIQVFLTSLKRSLLSVLISIDGILPNALLAVVHFIQILIIPIFSPIIFYLALCEMTTLSDYIWFTAWDFYDFYTPSIMDPWWGGEIPYTSEVIWIHLYVIAYMIAALVEVVSFYLTGYDNNGKFKVKYSLLKKFFTYSLYLSLIFFALLYFSMLCFVLVWAVLASIFNPSVYLPYSAAALTLVGTVTSKYQQIETRFRNLTKELERIIMEKIGLNFQKSLENVSQQGGESVLGSENVQILNQYIPSRAEQTNQLLGEGLDKIFSQISDSSITGDLGEIWRIKSLNKASTIAQVISNQLDGVSPMLIEFLIAKSAKDQRGIKTSVAMIQEEIGIEKELIDSLVGLGISDFDPSDFQKQPGFGQLKFNIKRIFRTLDPDMPVHDCIGILCKMILERDPYPMVKLIKQTIANIPNQQSLKLLDCLLDMLMEANIGEFASVQRNLLQFLDSMVQGRHRKYFQAFKLLVSLRSKDLSRLFKEQESFSDTQQLARLLGFKRCYPLICMAETTEASSSSVLLHELMACLKEILYEGKMISQDEIKIIQAQHNTHNQKLSTLESFYLGMIYLSVGDTIDLKSIAKEINSDNSKIPNRIGSWSIDESQAEILSRVGQKSADAFEQLLYRLNFTYQKDFMMEFFYLVIQQEKQYKKICGSLGIAVRMENTFKQSIYLLYYILLYDIQIRDYQSQNNPQKKNQIERQLRSLPDQICSCLKNITNYDGEKLVFAEIHKIRIGCPQFSQQNEEKLYFRKQTAAELEALRNQKSNSSIFQKHTIDPKGNTKELENHLYALVQDMFPATEYMEWKDTKQPPNYNESSTKTCHHELWDCVIRHLNIKTPTTKAFSMEALIFARQVAIVMLKINSIIGQEDPVYQSQLLDLAAFLQVDSNGLELCIDCISSNPLEIFKVKKKKNIINYKIQPVKCVFDGTFDYERAYILQQLLSTTPESLTQLFLRWLHQYKQYSQAKDEVKQLILPANGVGLEFMELVQSFNSMKRADYDAQQKQKLIKASKVYIVTIIRQFQEGRIQNSPKSLKNDRTTQILDLYQLTLDTLDLDINKVTQLLFHIKQPEYYHDHGDIKVDALMAILQATRDMLPDQIINLIIEIADLLCQGEDTKLQKADYIQLAMLLNAKRIDSLFKKKNPDSMKLSYNTSLLLNIDNESKAQKTKAFWIEEKDCQNYILTLYENHFFDKAEFNLIRPAWPNKINTFKIQKYSSNILGLLLGTSLNNQRLIRTSITSMISNESIQAHFVEGLISCFQKDTEASLSIKKFAVDLGLDGEFLVNLIDLTACESSSSFMKNIIFMLSTNYHKKDDKIISSCISLFKRDMSQVLTLIHQLQVDQRKATMLLAAAIGDMTILSEFYSDIQKYLGLRSQQTVAYLMQLAHGQTQCIYNLSSERSKTFKINDPQLFESVFKITYFGRQFTEGRIQHVPESVNNDFNHIAKKLSQVLGLHDGDRQNNSDNIKQGQKVMQMMPQKADQELTLAYSMRLLIRACWSDYQSIQHIIDLLCQTNDFWKNLRTILRDQIDEFFVKCLDSLQVKEIFSEIQMEQIRILEEEILPGLFEEVNRCAQQQRERLIDGVQECKPKVPDAGSGKAKKLIIRPELLIIQNTREESNKKFLNFQKKAMQGLKKLISYKNNPLKNAKQDQLDLNGMLSLIGCTKGIAGSKLVKQPVYICITCAEKIKDEERQVGLCIICAHLCHQEKGHEIKQVTPHVSNKHVCYCSLPNQKSDETLKQNTNQCCSIKHEYLKAMFSKSQEEIMQKIDQNHPHEPIRTYTTKSFLIDLEKSIQLPRQFQGLEQIFKDFVKDGNIEPLHRECLAIRDFELDMPLSVAQNFIRFAKGQPTQTLLSLLSIDDGDQKFYTKEDLASHTAYEQDGSSTTPFPQTYVTLSAFSAIAQQDIAKIHLYAIGLAQVMKEGQGKDGSASDQLCKVIKLVRGDEIPPHEIFSQTQIIGNVVKKGNADKKPEPSYSESNINQQSSKNFYVEFFKALFGIKWEPMITLHKALTVSRKHLLKTFFKKGSTDPVSPQDYLKLDQQEQQVENLRAWLNQTLFAKALSLESSSVNYCISLFGIIQKFPRALDFIANERKIPNSKRQLYKTLTLSMKQEEFKQLFKKSKQLINERVGNILYSVMMEKREDWLITLISEYIQVKSYPPESKESLTSNKVKIEDDPQAITQKAYIRSLFQLISCESGHSQEDGY